MNHELQDLSVPMAKVEANQRRRRNCKHHPLKELTHFCITCTEKICRLCLEDNSCRKKGDPEHRILNIQIKKGQLTQKLDLARNVIDTCGRVATEINRKDQELRSSGQDQLTSSINDLFDRMLNILEERREKVVQEAKEVTSATLSELGRKAEHVQRTKSSVEKYVNTGEMCINEMDAVATVNLFQHSKNFYKWLSERDQELNQGFDRFVEKDCYFQVDCSASEIFRSLNNLLDTVKAKYGCPSSMPSGSAVQNGKGDNGDDDDDNDNGNMDDKNDSDVDIEVLEAPSTARQLPYPKANSSITPTPRSSARIQHVAQEQGDNTTIEEPVSSNVGCSHAETQKEHVVSDGSSSFKTAPEKVSVSSSLSPPLSLTPLSIENKHGNGDANVSQKTSSSSKITPRDRGRPKSVRGSEIISPDPELPRLEREDYVQSTTTGDTLQSNSNMVTVSKFPGKSNGRVTKRKKLESVNPKPEKKQRKSAKKLSPEPVPSCFRMTDDTSADFKVAPRYSIVNPPIGNHDFPVQSEAILKMNKIVSNDVHDDYCFICQDGGDLNGKLVCCGSDKCPRTFHMRCCIPQLDKLPELKWKCINHTTKEMIDEMSHDTSSGIDELFPGNRKHFLLACKFLMEIYKIPESPTMRWRFPWGYLKMFGKTPFHLSYIRNRLCSGVSGRFSNVREMLLAFKQMITQALFFYSKKKKHDRKYAIAFSQQFLWLVEEYYPEERKLFEFQE